MCVSADCRSEITKSKESYESVVTQVIFMIFIILMNAEPMKTFNTRPETCGHAITSGLLLLFLAPEL